MKIVDDMPGRRLTLKGEGTTLPITALWLVLALVSPLVLVRACILWRVTAMQILLICTPRARSRGKRAASRNCAFKATSRIACI